MRRLEAGLTRLVCMYAPLRRAMAALAYRLVVTRGSEPLGFARLRDYATERLGLSARSIHDLAHVHGALEKLPSIESAFVSGRIPWTTTRLLARVATPADECQWLDRARGMTAAALAGDVRRVDVGARALDALRTDDINDDDDADDAAGARENILIRCTPQVRGKWYRARQLPGRVVGHPVPPWACAELVAAEVLSALPLDGIASGDPTRGQEERRGPVVGQADDPLGCDTGRHARANKAEQSFAVPERGVTPDPSAGPLAAAAATAHATEAFGIRPAVARWTASVDPSHDARETVPWLRSLVSSLLENVETAGPFQLDRRLRRAVRLDQRLDAELGGRSDGPPLVTFGPGEQIESGGRVQE
jgi:hypothetical protein